MSPRCRVVLAVPWTCAWSFLGPPVGSDLPPRGTTAVHLLSTAVAGGRCPSPPGRLGQVGRGPGRRKTGDLQRREPCPRATVGGVPTAGGVVPEAMRGKASGVHLRETGPERDATSVVAPAGGSPPGGGDPPPPGGGER